MKDHNVSVIVPVYNSEKSLEKLCDRLMKTLSDKFINYEIIFVNDSSKDHSWEVLIHIEKLYSGIVRIVNLMKNYGQHGAIMCGFSLAKGDVMVTIDDDLQQPPEYIPQMIELLDSGYDAVFASYTYKQHSVFRNLGTAMINKVNEYSFKKPKGIKVSSYRVITRKTVEDILNSNTSYPYISGMILNVTNNVANYPVSHERREYGVSNYKPLNLVSLANNLLFNYTTIPLKFMGTVCLMASMISFLSSLVFIIKKLIAGISIPGWTSLFVVVSFFFGLLFLFLFIIGEYISRLLNVNYKFSYIIRESKGFDGDGK